MKTEHFPSLELCRKLTEIGFPKTEWVNYDSYWNFYDCYDDRWLSNTSGAYFCPSVMEMLDVIYLPLHHQLQIEKQYDFNDWYWYHVCFYNKDILKWFQWQLPNALAEMILWLYDNKYLTFPTHD